MRYFNRTFVVAAGLACVVASAAAVVTAQENQNGASPTPAATNPTNAPQQAAAPIVDPHAAVQDAADGKMPKPVTRTDQNNIQQNRNATAAGQQAKSSGTTQEWPAPQRYESGRTTPGHENGNGRGGASLGVNLSEDGQGVVVSRIRPGTPAERMGLQPRDRILTLNGQPVVSVDEFVAAIRGMNIGEEVQLSIDRGGNARNISGKLEALRERIAAGEGPVRNLADRAIGILGRERGEGADLNAGPVGVNVQAGFEDGGQGMTKSSGDTDARITRLEQQLDRLTREIEQLRSGANASPAAGQTGGPGLPPAAR